jgi:N-carbamoyl-L-amino-acid hydrolase
MGAPLLRHLQTPEPDLALAARMFTTLADKTRDVLGVTRAAYGEGEQFAHDLVASEARLVGLETSVDAAGNLLMRLPGIEPDGRMALIGSHLDSVPMGGNFDGAAGVIAGLAILCAWAKSGYRPARDVAVIAIRAEESNWFPYSYVGSKAALGLLPESALEVRRSDTGRTLAAHMEALRLDPAAVRSGVPQIHPRTIRAYIELHIEQGPVLTERALPMALVTGIRGSFRYREARVIGAYAHSGAVPRQYRHDAVVGAADLVMRLHGEWLDLEAAGHDLTVTMGQLSTNADQHAFSKIAGEVDMSIDVRSHDTATLDEARHRLLRHADAVAAKHSVEVNLGTLTGSTPAVMDSKLLDVFGTAMEAIGAPHFTMPSGAGHDAAVFAGAGVPSLMLFVRNANGSHNPDEAMDFNDFAIATRVLSDGLARLA